MKRTLAIIAMSIALVGSLENPAYSCSASQTQQYNLAVRAMHMAVDISNRVGGEAGRRASLALMDLVDAINKTLPVSCGQDA